LAIKQIKSVADIPTAELDDWGPVAKPVSEQVSHLYGLIINEHEDGSEAGDTVYFDENSKGVWEVKQTVRKAYLTFKRG
jgi:uncharacterized cupin superfamily protein